MTTLASDDTSGPFRVLVMDDEGTVCDIVEKILTRCGYAVTGAPDGQTAVALYRQALSDGEPFDVVVLDLTVPGGIGGKEALESLLEADPQVKAIVSSGYIYDPVMVRPSRYGFKGVIVKPYTARALREEIGRVLKGD